ncbi:CDP-diacylglycerol--glycerol-3-phosphate 3-phosphatidyltransferase [Paenibacillus sacheonensis]|uniref:CDP-diacylglycerol--glycerol-3-phosphate 3-phosphatidyltransferase n=1 Tax=Paenibacillus sacheonensis TaxID=742054 RepID=A0A7X4YPW6_9BACL|nr:CDP-diacylglycerol--glycerol-3-phosphate 3-phosphatidyltransferase [Paenibacillus sacheonensis]MBM7564912.1 CDP-diacylglycerol--glycerol-3-phosphate 3-phosphatidyltransferase [Paenibacillus sacheonensis]NBC70298.1 CDP-diacylglycerol--glycerol-3-phosphate 3-phosphatidyltransferase [Paenibacillus sacheonensis]
MNMANKITVVRILMIPIFILLFPIYPASLTSHSALLQHLDAYGLYYAAGVFLLASATDKLDGYVARKYNLVTNLGKLLDPLADKLLISAALILMVSEHLTYAWVAFAIVAREFMITALRMVAASRRIALQADNTGKIKMVFQVVGITAVLLRNRPFAFFTSIPVDQVLLYAALVLTVYSGVHYIRNNYRRLELF